MGNLILDALPKHEYEVVRNRLSKSALRTAAVLFKANQPVRGVYFPINGLVSCFASNGQGNTVEAYSVGHEGVVELSAILTGRAIVLAKVQIPGAALWIAVDDLYELLRETTVFPRLLLHYACFVLIRSVLGTTCAKFHTVEQRLSLWLLLALERTSTQIIHCTHHALAQILGARRATVTSALQALQKAGTLQGARGQLAIADRLQLEGSACECFDAIRAASNVKIQW